jgi:hypothetical protein
VVDQLRYPQSRSQLGAAKPYCWTDETVVKQTATIRQILKSKPGCVKIIGAVAAIQGSTLVFS